MVENKENSKETSKKSEIVETQKKKPIAVKRPTKKLARTAPSATTDLWQAFNDTFERFRSDFEDILFPQNWQNILPAILPVRVPVVDLEDHEKEFVLKAEMPGFKKEDIEIEVQDDAVAITGYAGWKYDEKGKLYICKERACETFYRELDLPQEIKIDSVKADLKDGVLEITLPKKTPKQKRKIALK